MASPFPAEDVNPLATRRNRAELEAVLASGIFSRAPSLAQFLNYVCLKALNGEADQIKEYSIAVEALGRSQDFDQKEDAIVRVEAHRLRKRLKQYYETEGAGHEIYIVVPAGKYVPQFIEASQAQSPVPVNGAAVESNGDVPEADGESLALATIPEPPADIFPALPPPAPPPHRPWWTVIVAAAALAVVGAAYFAYRNWHSPATAALETVRDNPVAGDDDGIRIAAGLTAPKYVDSVGKTWLSDRWFLGGEIASSPPRAIGRTGDPVLFQNRREGEFRYRIPLDPGVYELHLYFCERVFGAGNLAGGGETSRLFHVFANGVPLVDLLDVVSDAGGPNTADVKVFKDIRPGPDGFLHLQFSIFKERAFVNGIAILPGIPGRMRPLRILAGSSSYRDRQGRIWAPDQFSLGGQIVTRSETVEGTTDPEIYQAERFGNFSYSIPLAEGRYAVTLHFAENWFGPSKPAAGGIGSRLFDVHANGVTLLKNFDIFKAAGGGNRVVTRTFRNLAPNAQGKLVLSFVPVANYACVNAIEVVAEGQ